MKRPLPTTNDAVAANSLLRCQSCQAPTSASCYSFRTAGIFIVHPGRHYRKPVSRLRLHRQRGCAADGRGGGSVGLKRTIRSMRRCRTADGGATLPRPLLRKSTRYTRPLSGHTGVRAYQQNFVESWEAIHLFKEQFTTDMWRITCLSNLIGTLRSSYHCWKIIIGLCRVTIGVGGGASIVYSHQTQQ